MYDKLCPMAFNHPTVVRTEMNCLGIACAWFNEASGQCAILDRAETQKPAPVKRSDAKKAE